MSHKTKPRAAGNICRRRGYLTVLPVYVNAVKSDIERSGFHGSLWPHSAQQSKTFTLQSTTLQLLYNVQMYSQPLHIVSLILLIPGQCITQKIRQWLWVWIKCWWSDILKSQGFNGAANHKLAMKNFFFFFFLLIYRRSSAVGWGKNQYSKLSLIYSMWCSAGIWTLERRSQQ